MPDFRVYKGNGKGRLVEVPPEEFGRFMGISNFDAHLLIKAMNITKTICMIAGLMENLPLIWNQNMPVSLIQFVSHHAIEHLYKNPAWSLSDFDWNVLYEDNVLRYQH